MHDVIMPSVETFRKRVLFALFSLMILNACSTPCRQWQLTSNTGSKRDFCSSLLYLSPEDKFSGLEVAIFNTSAGKTTYINVFGIELESEGQSPEGYPTIAVTFCIDGHPQAFLGFLLQGNHRILLPENASNILVEALHQNQIVDISVTHYSTRIIPDNFVKHYQKF